MSNQPSPITPSTHLQWLRQELAAAVAGVAATPANAPIPTCPGWTTTDLVVHLGGVHRWASELVRTQATRWFDRSTMDLGVPQDPIGLPAWLRAGGDELLDVLEAADPTQPMWTWATARDTGWWFRRQVHETLVHRIDLDLAAGRTPTVDAPVATDAVDEFLTNLPAAARFTPEVHQLRGSGSLHLHATDPDLDGRGEWLLTLNADGFTVGHGHAKGDVAVRGPALSLLLFVTRRATPDTAGVELLGDADLARFWWENSRLT